MWRYLLPPLVMSSLVMNWRGHRLRRREGNIPIHVRPAGRRKWRHGQAVWVHNVLAFRAGPAARRETLFWVTSSYERAPTSEERWWIHRHGGDIVLGTLLLDGGGSVEVAVRRQYGPALFGDVRLEEAA
jgi:hypothetical protein